MIRFLRALPIHFKSAVQGLIRHSATAFSAISAVTVTLILMSLFMLLTGNIDSFTRNIESDFKIHTSIDSLQTQEQIDALQAQIEKMDGVKSVVFSSKENEIEELMKVNKKMFEMYQGDGNPMPNAFIIEVYESKQIDSVSNLLDEMEGVDKSEYGGDSVSVMIRLFESIRNGGLIFVSALGLLAIFLISNTIRMTIYARKVEIGIMRNVGAGNWYIRIPFIFEGMFIGLIGAIIPVLFTYFGYEYLYNALDGQFLTSMFIMREVNPFAITICLVLTISGIVVGMIGSFLAVSKYLRWKR